MSARARSTAAGGIAVAAISAAALLAGSGAASARTATTVTFHTGGDANTAVIYMCNFPAIGAQPLEIRAAFDGPDTVASGSVNSPSNVRATATLSAQHHSLLTAIGYDGVRGKSSVTVAGSNATPATATVANLDIPEQIYPKGGAIDIQAHQDAGTTVPAFTAGSPGVGTASISSPMTVALQFHKVADGSWTPWNLTCTIKVTNPAQNTTFGPSVTIT